MGKTGRCVFIGVLAIAAACGGGGGGGGGSSDGVLSGSYQYVYLEHDVAAGTVLSETATFEADGAGHLAYGVGWQSDEGTGTAIRRANGTYALDGSRTLQVAGGFPSTLTGYVSRDGRFGSALVQSGARDPAMMFFMRRNPSPTLSALTGEWRLVEWFRRDPDRSVVQSGSSRAEIHASGWLDRQDYFYNYDGAIDPTPVMFAATHFGIGTNGAVLLGDFASPAWLGSLSERGDVVLLGGREAQGRKAAVRILCRVGEAVGAGSVSGDWYHVLWEAMRPGYCATWGTPSFDGVDQCSGPYWTQCGAGVGESWPFVFVYGVGSTSQASLALSGVSQWSGVAGDGIAVLAGGYVPGRPPGLHVIIR